MRVVIDNNLPRSLARLLTADGIEAVHVIDLDLGGATDHMVRASFSGEPIIFLSRDGDFWSAHPSNWVVIWIALHNPTLAQLKGPMLLSLTRLIPTLRSGQKVLLAADQIRIFSAP